MLDAMSNIKNLDSAVDDKFFVDLNLAIITQKQRGSIQTKYNAVIDQTTVRFELEKIPTPVAEPVPEPEADNKPDPNPFAESNKPSENPEQNPEP